MKRTPAIALFALFCLGVAATAIAQEPAVRANVPFEFTVGGRLLPADTYTIKSAAPGTIQIQSADNHFVFTTAILQDNNQPNQGSKLVFEKYGDQYFLHEVLSANIASMNVNIPTSKLKKKVHEEARLGQGEPVLVAAR